MTSNDNSRISRMEPTQHIRANWRGLKTHTSSVAGSVRKMNFDCFLTLALTTSHASPQDRISIRYIASMTSSVPWTYVLFAIPTILILAGLYYIPLVFAPTALSATIPYFRAELGLSDQDLEDLCASAVWHNTPVYMYPL
jgi:hypothetical protein